MTIWFASLAAPALVLCDQVVAYAAVGWACSHEGIAAVHAIHAFFIILAGAGAIPAFRLWTATRMAGSEALERRHFLAGLALASSVLSVLVIASMWMPTWVIAPCAN